MHILEKVYPRIKDRLWRYLYSLTKNADLAEDFFQSAFEKTIPVVAAGRLTEESVVPYLFRVARNEFLNYARKTRRETDLVLDPLATTGAPDQSARIQGVLVAYLARSDLAARQREVLELRFFAELGADEIAAALETSRRTVYRELQAGLEGLRLEFERQGLTPEDLA